MQVHYQYVPPTVEQTPVKTLKQTASITIFFKRNGSIVPPPDFKYDGEIEIRSGSFHNLEQDDMIVTSINTLRIKLVRGGRIFSSYKASQKLVELKDKLPEIFLKMADSLSSEPLVDLMTGKTVEQKISIEYLFHDEVYDITYKETKEPAWIYFHCPTASRQTAASGTWGKLTIEYGQAKISGSWRINNMGWLQPPDATQEDLKGAFEDLANNLLQQGMPSVQTWWATSGTVISLE